MTLAIPLSCFRRSTLQQLELAREGFSRTCSRPPWRSPGISNWPRTGRLSPGWAAISMTLSKYPGVVALSIFGDVSGKDIPAAMLTGVIHGAVRSSSWTRSAAEHNDATGQLNRLLYERASRERSVSMVWSYFDPETELLHYVNAGHPAPLLFRASGHGPSPVLLSEGGPVLGQ